MWLDDHCGEQAVATKSRDQYGRLKKLFEKNAEVEHNLETISNYSPVVFKRQNNASQLIATCSRDPRSLLDFGFNNKPQAVYQNA